VILVLPAAHGTKPELIVPDGRTNAGHSLSAKIRDYRSNDNVPEVNPINEGFILLAEQQKKPSPLAISLTTTAPTKAKRTSTVRSFSNVTTTTTCETKHKTASTSTNKTSTTILFQSSSNGSVHATEDESLHRRGRKILTAASYDTDADTSTAFPLFDDNDQSDVENFLRVDDEELTKQLVNLAVMADGSGFSE
jgi:hypothetical protein